MGKIPSSATVSGKNASKRREEKKEQGASCISIFSCGRAKAGGGRGASKRPRGDLNR